MSKGRRTLTAGQQHLVQVSRAAKQNRDIAKSTLKAEIYSRADAEYQERMAEYEKSFKDSIWSAYKGGVPGTVILEQVLQTKNRIGYYDIINEMKEREESSVALGLVELPKARYTLGDLQLTAIVKEGVYSHVFNIIDSKKPNDRFSDAKEWAQVDIPDGPGILVHARLIDDAPKATVWWILSDSIGLESFSSLHRTHPDLNEFITAELQSFQGDPVEWEELNPEDAARIMREQEKQEEDEVFDPLGGLDDDE